MAIGRRAARSRIRCRQSAAALLLVLLLVPETALAVWRHAGHDCGSRHDSCPLRPAAEPEKPAPPSCHDASGRPAPPPPTGTARSLHAACGCGVPHSPALPHRESRAVLEAATPAFLLLPTGSVAPQPGPLPAFHVPAPESPPPRSPLLPG